MDHRGWHQTSPASQAASPYLDFLCLLSKATLALTDSGGIQEETTALGIPCLTLRENTERQVTVSQGTNVLAGTNPSKIMAAVEHILRGESKIGRTPPLWDGHAAERIVEILLRAGLRKRTYQKPPEGLGDGA